MSEDNKNTNTTQEEHLNKKRVSERHKDSAKKNLNINQIIKKQTFNVKKDLLTINKDNKNEIIKYLMNDIGLADDQSTLSENNSLSNYSDFKNKHKKKMNPLKFKIIKSFNNRARASVLELLHGKVNTPIFMPVGTKAAMKGLLSCDLERMKCNICLSNTYHLTLQPGDDFIFDNYSGVHNFMNWNKNLLTDSGGFQMVSLDKNTTVTEEGVEFSSHIKDDNRRLMLTPEKSIQIQNNLGSDIIMMLDDVLRPNSEPGRLKEACERTIRWLDRCIKAHKNPDTQNLFPIVQGGLDLELRKWCIEEMIKRNQPGYAIGGLAGGETKDDFWKVVNISCKLLPKDKPRYLMGVGYPIDLVVCSLLGVDMFDCVFPTRTGRFGTAFTNNGFIKLKSEPMKLDFNPIEKECDCEVCLKYTRSYFYLTMTNNPRSASLVSYHNVYYLLKLMGRLRKSITDGKVQEFATDFFIKQFSTKNSETIKDQTWVFDALQEAGIDVDSIKNSINNK